MKIRAMFISIGCVLMLTQGQIFAQTQQYFRVRSSGATVITSIDGGGHITWTNAMQGATCIVEVADTLVDTNDWRSFAQIPVTSAVIRAHLFDPNPPQGMALIPAGCFQMGDSLAVTNLDGDSTELPVHTVYLNEFYMDRTGVSLALWMDVFNWATNRPDDVAYQFDNPGVGKALNHPVVAVSWYDIVKWSNARSEKEGLTPAYYTSADMTTVYRIGRVDVSNNWVKWSGCGYRIPTEAQFEKAARGGLIGRRFPLGDTISFYQANFNATTTLPYDLSGTNGMNPVYADGVSPYTCPVDAFQPNGYALYNMAGNGLQWNWDWYDGGWYTNALATQIDTPGPASGMNRQARGGCWVYTARYVRCASRIATYGLAPTAADSYYGFRCVR